MYYSEQASADLATSYASLDERHRTLFDAYHAYAFKSGRAKEFAEHAFLRRFDLMLHCIKQVFDLIPPKNEEIPSRDVRTQALVNIHAFNLNTYGAIDNLAWIWVEEKKIRRPDGSSLPKDWVGLGPKNSVVRATLSDDFRGHLRGLKRWFRYLEDFRHSLAHRVPMYIAPYVIEEKDEARYKELAGALARFRHPRLQERLQAQQDELKKFAPWLQHSFGEKSKRIVFHPQLLRDFATVEELAWKMITELEREVAVMPLWRRCPADLWRGLQFWRK
jgi:hypothetical protein